MADTPMVRFKGFIDAWEQCKLGEILQTLPYKEYISTPEQNGKYEIIQQGNEPIIGFADGTPCSDYKDTVIFGDHTLSLYKPNRPFFVATDGVRIVKGKQYIDGFFLMAMLEKYKPQSEGYKRYYSILADSDCYFTEDDEEQCKIGELFEHLDNLVTLHQRKCDETKELKKYMLQKMLPQKGKKIPEIRFAGFIDDWEQSKLGEIAEFSKGNGYSKGDLIDTGIPIILYGRLYTKYETIIREVDTFVLPKSGSVYSKGGEVIVPASGETAEDIARAATVENAGVILGGDLNIISPNDNINSAFLALSISNGASQKELAKKAQGKSVVHIHNEEIKALIISFPSKPEQDKITAYFSDLDHLITLHQRKCDYLKEVKKFMLQNMFPQKG